MCGKPTYLQVEQSFRKFLNSFSYLLTIPSVMKSPLIVEQDGVQL